MAGAAGGADAGAITEESLPKVAPTGGLVQAPADSGSLSMSLSAESRPIDVRNACREGAWTQHTAGLAAGFAQANLVILPMEQALDFAVFAQRNPKPCPVLDMVAFALGCSFSFEAAMLEEGLPVRHLEEGKNVPMYRTNRPCRPAGAFRGNLVVSMRPMTPDQARRAVNVTRAFPRVHGSPVQVGRPEALGIQDVSRPDFGDPVTVRAGEECVFWACGVTPQVAVMDSKPPLCITHAPGHMLLLDVRNADLAGTGGE